MNFDDAVDSWKAVFAQFDPRPPKYNRLSFKKALDGDFVDPFSTTDKETGTIFNGFIRWSENPEDWKGPYVDYVGNTYVAVRILDLRLLSGFVGARERLPTLAERFEERKDVEERDLCWCPQSLLNRVGPQGDNWWDEKKGYSFERADDYTLQRLRKAATPHELAEWQIKVMEAICHGISLLDDYYAEQPFSLDLYGTDLVEYRCNFQTFSTSVGGVPWTKFKNVVELLTINRSWWLLNSVCYST